MGQPAMPSPVAQDANKVIAKLQIRHAGVQGAAEKELAITQVAYEELQEQYAAVVAERDTLLEKLAEMTASETAEDAEDPAPATPSSALMATAVNGHTPRGVSHAD